MRRERHEIRITAPDAHQAVDRAKAHWRRVEPPQRIRTVASVRPVDEDFGSDGRREAELILALPGAKQERGYRGYEACPRAARE